MKSHQTKLGAHFSKRSRERLQRKIKISKRSSREKMTRLLQEMQANQITLEMQNEELRETQARLEESRNRYSDLYDFAPVSYFTFDRGGLIREANLTGANHLGIGRQQLIGTPFSLYVAQEDQIRFRTHLEAVFHRGGRHQCEIKIEGKSAPLYVHVESLLVEENAGPRHCQTALTRIPPQKTAEKEIEQLNESLKGQILLRTAELRAANQALENEIIERMKAEQVLARQANRDSLTGLYNRRYFDLRVDEEIARADRKGGCFAILLCDLNYFRVVTHPLGYQTGDRILKMLAQKAVACIRESDLVFRWRGNAIAVLLTDTSREGVLIAAERIQKAVANVSEEAQVLLNISIGAALYPEHGLTMKTLINLAEHSLSVSKQGEEKVHIGNGKHGLDEQDIRMVFQPVVDLRSSQPIGYEALTRDPQGKLTAPELFRRYQTIGQLNKLKQFCFRSQLNEVQRLGLQGKRFFLNVDFHLLDQIAFFQKPEGIDVILEISEREALHSRHLDRYFALAEKWRGGGFQIAIDDFGAGSVSFPFVGKMVPDYIKLDRSTLLQAISSPKVREFLSNLVLAFRKYTTHGMIAEGIETEKELAVVRDLGIDLGQGFLLGRPNALVPA